MIAFQDEERIYEFIKQSFPCPVNEPLNPRVMKYSRLNLTNDLCAEFFAEVKKR